MASDIDPRDRWAGMPEQKRALLERRLKQAHTRQGTKPEIAPRSNPKHAPLSFAQERLWFLDQLEPGLNAYNRIWAVRMRGPLKPQALEHAINRVIQRHEILRTTFHQIDGHPHQTIHASLPLSLRVENLKSIPHEDREEYAMNILNQDALLPFDLKQLPLVRPLLVRLEDDDHILSFTVHHIAFDGWSERLVLSEMGKFYSAHAVGQEWDLPPLKVQYADFSEWQRTSFVGDRLEEQGAFWEQELDGAPPVLDIYADHPRPKKQAFHGGRLRRILPAELAQAANRISREQGTTLFMTLLGAYYLTLYANSGQMDLLIGTSIANRNRIALEKIVGFFTNTLVIRTSLENDPTFLDLLGRVRQSALRSFDHQDMPFEKLVERINPPRSLGHTPIVQATFAVRNLPDFGAPFHDLSIERVDLDVVKARFDLTLEAQETAEGLRCTLFYDRGLFESGSAERLLNQYEDVLAEALANPTTPLSGLKSLHRAAIQAPAVVTEPRELDAILEKTNLSGNQFLMWTAQKLRPQDPIYNLTQYWDLKGPLQPDAFAQAFQCVIDRFEPMRTVFREADGIPQREVLPQLSSPLQRMDYSKQANPRQESAKWIEARSRVKFPLDQPLFESALIKLAEDDWRWMLRLHHMITDGTSTQLLYQHMQAYYQAALEGTLEAMPPLPSYNLIVAQERRNRRSPRYAENRRYWQEKLAEPLSPLAFYGEQRQRQSTRIYREYVDLGPMRTQAFRKWAQSEGLLFKSSSATLQNIFAALLLTLIEKITGERRLRLASPFRNRRSELERTTPGLLMQILPLQIEIEQGETFSSLVRKVSFETQDILRHREYTVRSPLNQPLFEIGLNFHTAAYGQFLDFETNFTRVFSGHEEETLALQVRDYSPDESIRLEFDFHADVFLERDRKRLIEHFMRLANAFLIDPDQALDDVELLSPAERTWLLEELNSTHSPLPANETVVSLFEKQVQNTPQSPAVEYENQGWTYEQLNARANQIAHTLRGFGVGAEDIVGLAVDKSLDMAAAMLGILKAGAAYLPMDPAFPEARLQYMLDDSDAEIVITSSPHAKRFHQTKAIMLCLDRDLERILAAPSDNPRPLPDQGHLAYVIYTSGSTGQPKGVAVEHRSLHNYACWLRAEYGHRRSDRVLQFNSISWDGSIEEIFPTLITGATLVLRTASMIDTFAGFLEQCEALGITTALPPTAYWHELVRAMEEDGLRLPSSIRLVAVGGERASPQIVAKWFELTSADVRLINAYGPTEATVSATKYELTGRQAQVGEWSDVPIGKPLPNSQTYVLNPAGKPVPQGVPGELFIGGACLARGYINRPEETAQRFLPNPFSEEPGARMYRTGDLVRHLPSGDLVFLGRLDQQVKVRGHRIELGEVESVIREYAAIDDCAMIARREKDSTHTQLLAYVVLRAGVDQDAELHNLQTHIKAQLPAFMLPAAIIPLPQIPRALSGKVDGKALPTPESAHMTKHQSLVEPRDQTERQLARIWGEVLGVSPIGVHDNFFELGGHSLLAVRLFSQIEKQLSVQIPLASLFEAPTIAQQADFLRRQSSPEDHTRLVPIRSGGDKPPLICVSPSIIDVITYHDIGRHLDAEQPFYALYSPLIKQWNRALIPLEEVAADLLAEMRTLVPRGPFYLAGYSAGGVIALEIGRQLLGQGEEVGLLLLLDTFGPEYPKMLPWVTPRIYNALLVLRRVQSYIWKFSLLNWKERLNYIRFEALRKWVQDRTGELMRNKHIQAEERRVYITRGRKDYNPKPYPGRVVLFRAQKSLLGVQQDPSIGWGEIIQDLEVCYLPGDHEALLFGPRSRAVAEKITEVLERAYREQDSSSADSSSQNDG